MCINPLLVTLEELQNLSDSECLLLARFLNMLAECRMSERGSVTFSVKDGKIIGESWESQVTGENGEMRIYQSETPAKLTPHEVGDIIWYVPVFDEF
jgi:hypothetical protein